MSLLGYGDQVLLWAVVLLCGQLYAPATHIYSNAYAVNYCIHSNNHTSNYDHCMMCKYYFLYSCSIHILRQKKQTVHETK